MTSRRKSYTVLAACTLVFFLTLIPIRIAAIIFVACIDRYKVSRAIATYPSVLFTSVRCLMGPVVAYLGEKIGIKATITIGCAISGLGIAACYLAEHIAFVIISYGIISGFGASLSNSLIHHVLRPYFKDNYSLVCGISLCGGCFGSFVFPPIAEKLIKEYGVSGMFLLIGAIMLNGIPVSLLIQEKIVKKVLSKPNQIPKLFTLSVEHTNDSITIYCNNDDICERLSTNHTDTSTEHQKQISMSDDKTKTAIHTVDGRKEHSPRGATIGGIKHVVSTNDGKIKFTNPQYAQENIFLCYQNNVETEDENISKSNGSRAHSYSLNEYHQNRSSELEIISPNVSEQTHTGGSESVDDKKEIRTVSSKVFGEEHGTAGTKVAECGNTLKLRNNFPEKRGTIEAVCSKSSQMGHDSKNNSCLGTLRTHFYTFLDPSVIIILLAAGSVTYVYLIIMTITIDLSREKNLPRENEIYLLTVGSVTEIVGSLFLGRIPDRGYLSIVQFAICSFLGYAVVCALLVWSTNFATYLIGITSCGIFVSGIFLTIPGLVYEFIDEKKQVMVQASKYMLYGVLCFAASPLIGYFRDNRGSYTGVLYVQSLICVACAIMIGILPLLAKRKMSEK